MKKVTLLAALVLSTAAFSQKIKITELHISNGSGFGGQINGSIDDFKPWLQTRVFWQWTLVNTIHKDSQHTRLLV